MIKKFLQDIGLNEKEVSIYLELLKVDNNSVLDLAKKTGILRTTIYPIIESLKEKGLVSEIEVGKKINFQAEPPERIAAFIESQRLKVEEQSQLANEFIPQLKSLSRQTGEKPIVKVYEGRDGIFKANEESFGYSKPDKNDIAYFIYPYDLIESFFSGQEIKKSSTQRINRHIKSRAIYTYTKGERPKSEDSVRLKIDGKKYPIKCDISIFKDMIRIHTLGKSLSSMVIKSQDIADTLKSLFEAVFDNQKKIGK
jgi:predicted DNA-binding transcriptional regulator